LNGQRGACSRLSGLTGARGRESFRRALDSPCACPPREGNGEDSEKHNTFIIHADCGQLWKAERDCDGTTNFEDAGENSCSDTPKPLCLAGRDGVRKQAHRQRIRTRWNDFAFLSGELLAALRTAEARTATRRMVVSNPVLCRPGIAIMARVAGNTRRMLRSGAGWRLDRQRYYCVHAPGDACNCRKPQPGHDDAGDEEHQAWTGRSNPYVGDPKEYEAAARCRLPQA